MEIIEQPIEWYVNKLQEGEYFSLPGYSDAEWFSMLHVREGAHTALGQEMNRRVGELLRRTLERLDSTVLPAVPKILKTLPGLDDGRMDVLLGTVGQMGTTFYERDMITDDLAEGAGLYPLIRQLQTMRTVVISHKAIGDIDQFLAYDKFVEISTPNFHNNLVGLDRAAKELIDYGKPAVYLFSAGMSAPLLIDAVRKKIPKSWFLDVGSMWDAFVGVGGQREWRAKLYEDKEALEDWKYVNIHGKPRERPE